MRIYRDPCIQLDYLFMSMLARNLQPQIWLRQVNIEDDTAHNQIQVPAPARYQVIWSRSTLTSTTTQKSSLHNVVSI